MITGNDQRSGTEGKILLVKEVADGRWALPGGWADIGLSPYEVVVKEIKEEAGFLVKPIRLLGILDKKFHDHPSSAYHEYMVYILCEIIDGIATHGMETAEVGFFDEDHLPELSASRNTKNQIKMLFEFLNNPNKDVLCE